MAAGIAEPAGSIAWLYSDGEQFESGHVGSLQL